MIPHVLEAMGVGVASIGAMVGVARFRPVRVALRERAREANTMDAWRALPFTKEMGEHWDLAEGRLIATMKRLGMRHEIAPFLALSNRRFIDLVEAFMSVPKSQWDVPVGESQETPKDVFCERVKAMLDAMVEYTGEMDRQAEEARRSAEIPVALDAVLRMRDIEVGIPATFAARARIGATRTLAGLREADLPDEARALIRSIRSLLDKGDALAGSDQDMGAYDYSVVVLKFTREDYLPETIRRYFAIPAENRSLPIRDDKSANDMLVGQLQSLETNLREAVAGLTDRKVGDFIVHDRFISAKASET